MTGFASVILLALTGATLVGLLWRMRYKHSNDQLQVSRGSPSDNQTAGHAKSPTLQDSQISIPIIAGAKPVVFYKYRPIDINTLRTIANNKLWFADPQSFNDPYDCRISLNPPTTQAGWERFFAELEKYYPKEPELQSAAVADYITRLLKDPSLARQLLDDSVQSIRSKRGVCALSSVNDNILMFSHYSDCHRGLCLEFSADPKAYFAKALKVKYCLGYPEVNLETTSFGDAAIALLLSKAEAWSYEGEYRIIEREIGLHDFPESELTGIIFGCETSDDDIKLVQSVAFNRAVVIKYYRAKRGYLKYSLDVVPL
jgi:hypothetical protein